jgi:hypothetical protein
VSARTDAAETARRLTALAASNTLAAERDNAIMQRDTARRECMGLQTQLRMALKERDEARALGRSA